MALASRFNRALLTGVTAAAIVATAGPASAGGFLVSEQSTYFQGMSFAGTAAGGSLSSMFWNSAAVAQFDGINSYSSYSLILPQGEITATAGSTLLFNGAKSGDIGDTAVVPSSYMSYQLNDKVVLGMSLNAPFGLTTDPSNFLWAGSTFARESKIETYDFNPTIAYRLSDSISIGVGLQLNYMKAGLRQSSGVLATSRPLVVKGDDWGVGFTAGIIAKPVAGTTIGLGYRSRIDHEIEGSVFIPGSPVPPAAAGAPVTADVTLPDIVTLSLRQAMAPNWTLLGSVQWTNWSLVPKLDIRCAGAPNPVFCNTGAPQLVRTLELGWHDGWLFSAGLEHQYNSQLTLRAGLAYEISPIQNPDERTIRVPDADRIWASIGASYQWSENTKIDLAYSHVFIEDSRTDRTESGIRLVGDVESSADIISVGVHSKLDWLLGGK